MDGGSVARVSPTLRRRLAWVALPTALTALGSGIFVNAVAPRYTGEAMIIVEGRTPVDGRAMVSNDLAREAVRRLKLVGNPEFDPAAGSIGPVQQVMMLLGIAANPLDLPSEDRVIESFLDRLRVSPAGASRTITIAFDAEDAQLAADAANTVAQLSVAALEAGKAVAGAAADPADGAATTLRRRLAEAEAKVEAFRAQHGLAGAPAGSGQALSTPQLNELTNQLSQARLARADIAGRVAAIREMLKDGRAYEIGDVAATDTFRRMIDARVSARAQLALESRTLLPAHPRIKELKAQLADLDGQIKIAAERAVLTLENDAKIAEGRVTSLQAAVDGQQSAVKVNADGIELRALERDAKTLREQLDATLGRAKEAAASEGRVITRIAMQATAPALPSFPEKLPIVGAASLVAFLLSLGGVLAQAFLGRRGRAVVPAVEPEQDSPARTALPPLVANPFALPEALPPGRWEVTASQAPVGLELAFGRPFALAKRPASSPFDLDPLLARLARRAVPSSRCGRTIMVVDAGMSASGELHTALAQALRRSGSVIAVDLDASPSSGGMPGLTDVVGGQAAFADVIQADGPGGAHHVAAGLAGTDILFDEPRALAFTLEAMAEAYGWVICRLHRGPDTADLLALVATLSDTVVIASDADPADPVLGDLYGIATDAGAGQVLIAQDRPALSAQETTVSAYDLAA
jgi:uncharacterized protein involved in exopolysaccharide biosynthesis